MGSEKQIEDKMTRLKSYVNEHRMKSTKQREIIAEVFFQVEDHLSAEDLLLLVREKVPTVSLATVYRTLKLLVEAKLADARNFGDSQTKFEPAGSHDEHHDHLICSSCGDIVEFVDDRIEELQHLVAKEHGYKIVDHKMELYGECPKCQ